MLESINDAERAGDVIWPRIKIFSDLALAG